MRRGDESEYSLGEPLDERLHRLAREFSELERLRRDVRKAEKMLKRRGRLPGRAGTMEPLDTGSIINKN